MAPSGRKTLLLALGFLMLFLGGGNAIRRFHGFQAAGNGLQGDNNMTDDVEVMWPLQHGPVMGRISNGLTANPGEFPSSVRLIRKFEAKGQNTILVSCTGTIISPVWILTAAHCLGRDFLYNHLNPYITEEMKHDVKNTITIKAGIVYVNDNNIPHIKKFELVYNKTGFLHPQAKTYRNKHHLNGRGVTDIALLKLKGDPFKFDSLVKPIALVKGAFPSGSKVTCTSVGFGARYGLRSNGMLHYFHRKAEDYSTCFHGICANNNRGQNLSTAEAGDSGGPLICGDNDQVAAVEVLSSTCTSGPNTMRKYTYIDDVMDWIVETTNNRVTILEASKVFQA